MILDWVDIATLMALGFAAAALAALAWVIGVRRKERQIGLLRAELAAVRTDPQAAMAEFLEAGAAVLKRQSDDLHARTVGLELEIARKRKRVSDLDKRPDRKDGEVAFQQEALALLNRRLVEYQAAARRTQSHIARSLLFQRRLARGALDAALAPRYVEEANAAVAAAKADAHERLREAVLDGDARQMTEPRARLAILATWRAKASQDRRLLPPMKRPLAR